MCDGTFTDDDLRYIRGTFASLEDLCSHRAESATHVRALIESGQLPRPSYVLDDGTEMVPTDYFRLVDEAAGPEHLRAHFARLYRDACAAHGVAPNDLDDDWRAYLDGVYGVCLRAVTPEAIVRKGQLVTSLCVLLTLARPADSDWRGALRQQIGELEGLEREFAPDYDRDGNRFGRLPTRDLLIGAAHEGYPEAFDLAAAQLDEAAERVREPHLLD